MKKRGIILSLVFLFTLLMLLNSAEAGITAFTKPTANCWVNGTAYRFLVTVTNTNPGYLGNISNVTWSYRQGTSGDWTYFGESINTTVSNPNFNLTFDTTVITDGITYQFNATAWNGSEDEGWTANSSLIVTGITVDNTAPTATMTIDNIVLELESAFGVTIDCTKSTDSADSRLSAKFYLTDPSGNTDTATKNNQTASDLKYNFDDRLLYDEYGTYTATCRIYDDVEQRTGTEATNLTLQVGSAKNPVKVAVGIQVEEEKEKAINKSFLFLSGAFLLGAIFLIILIYFVWWKE